MKPGIYWWRNKSTPYWILVEVVHSSTEIGTVIYYMGDDCCHYLASNEELVPANLIDPNGHHYQWG
jgi:hypothetical protein